MHERIDVDCRIIADIGAAAEVNIVHLPYHIDAQAWPMRASIKGGIAIQDLHREDPT